MRKIGAFIIMTVFILFLAWACSVYFWKWRVVNYSPQIIEIGSSHEWIVITPVNLAPTGEWEVFTWWEYSISGKKITVFFYKKNRIFTSLIDKYFHTNQTYWFEKLNIPLVHGTYELYYKNKDGSLEFIKSIEYK